MDNKGASVWVIVTIIAIIFLLGVVILPFILNSDLPGNVNQTIIDTEIPLVDQGDYACFDNDSGKNYFAAGNLTTIFYWRIDVCDATTGVVTETYCEGDLNMTTTYTCPNGCDGNACKGGHAALGDCLDGDGGKNYFTPGKTVDTLNFDSFDDSCEYEVNGRKIFVKEYFCDIDGRTDEVVIDYTRYKCPYGCINGACCLDEDCKSNKCIGAGGVWKYEKCWLKSDIGKNCTETCSDVDLDCQILDWSNVPKICELHEEFSWPCPAGFCFETPDNSRNSLAPFMDSTGCYYYNKGAVNNLFDCDAQDPVVSRICPCEIEGEVQ